MTSKDRRCARCKKLLTLRNQNTNLSEDTDVCSRCAYAVLAVAAKKYGGKWWYKNWHQRLQDALRAAGKEK